MFDAENPCSWHSGNRQLRSNPLAGTSKKHPCGSQLNSLNSLNIKVMKDLQELFETLGHDEVKRLAELVDKKSVNPKNIETVLNHVSAVYCAEMGVDEAEVTEKEMGKLLESFQMSCTLYLNVLIGHMEIKSGRLKLTDGESCSFGLTKAGIKHVEQELLPNLKK